jgi:hypothetical protein
VNPAALEARLGAGQVTNYLKAMAMETATLARACGKSDVHNLEPNDLVALTVEAAAMAQVPWPAPNGFRPPGQDLTAQKAANRVFPTPRVRHTLILKMSC